MDDLIRRKDAIELIENESRKWGDEYGVSDVLCDLADLPPAQPERRLYANMSDAEFENWLYEHGICHPNIHESIPCDVVPLLIDNAISELPSAQPEDWMERNKDRILQAGKEGREVEFRMDGRLFAIREKAQ